MVGYNNHLPTICNGDDNGSFVAIREIRQYEHLELCFLHSTMMGRLNSTYGAVHQCVGFCRLGVLQVPPQNSETDLCHGYKIRRF